MSKPKFNFVDTTENLSFNQTIKEATSLILNCRNDFRQMKESVDTMYHIFSSISGVTINTLSEDKDILLSQGKAISTSAAAHCLLEMKRTALFLRGINKAIIQKLRISANKPIRVLYAGTGPYGTLITPLLTLYKTEEICIDLLDINSNSLVALKKITKTLDLDKFIKEIYCADATTFKVNKPYDIVISETMLACLKSEPQVAIMQNLIPQLTDESIFIPEEISIDASLTNPQMEMNRQMYNENEMAAFERVALGNIFKVGKLSMSSIESRKTVSIQNKKNDFPILKLFTTVKVYEDEILTENDSSITLPKQYHDFRKQNAREIEFWYVPGENPRIESSVLNMN